MTQNPLESTYRPIRRVAPPDVPIAGVLAAEGDRTVLLADVDAIPSQWWRDDPAAHLLAPVDVARRADGHDAVLPWCVVTVGSYLRARSDEPLSGGEGVTLAVSLMRGCVEAALPARFGDDPVPVPHGRWWLTDQGQPLFAVGEGVPAREETAQLLSLLAGACSDRVVARLATEAADSVRVRSPATVLVRLEEAMFEACAPRPLLVRVADPVSLRPLEARELRSPGETRSVGTETQFIGAGRHDEPRRGSSEGWTERVRAAMRNLLPAVRGRADSPRTHSRRTPVLLGASLAAVILTVGLLWPQPDGDGSAAGATSSPTASGNADPGDSAAGGSPAPPTVPGDIAASEPSATDHTSTEPQPVDTPATPEQADTATLAPEEGAGAPSSREAEVIATAAALLGAVAACAEEDTCGPLVAEGVDLAQVPAGGAIELIEDFGGVVVLRVIGDGGETSLLSIERVDGAWRVREVTPMSG
ncbi:hypothetical protein [Microbacterium sp. ZW T5_56]|uniref:hypothetical protein n=1 Tax=Microbacterium sp. ZW T5_56 TaxID=3378081 RepID=UPI0038553AFE